VLELPALRDRREDLGVLLGGMLARGGRLDVRLELDAAMSLFLYDWPSNVRELERALSAALVLAENGLIARDHWPATLRGPQRASGRFATPARPQPTTAPPPMGAPAGEDDLGNEPIAPAVLTDPADIALRDRLIELLTQHEGNLTAVAREMNKDRTQIRRWLRRFGIDVDALRR
jgi:transcriptional regulator of acetoin/glycerol metabolism